MDGEKVGQLATTVSKRQAKLERLEAMLKVVKAKLKKDRARLKRTIKRLPQASGNFKKELARKVPEVVPTRTASELEDVIHMNHHTRQKRVAFRGYAKSFHVRILDDSDPIVQLRRSRDAARRRLVSELGILGGVKFIEVLKVTLAKEKEEGWETHIAYASSKAKTINNEEEIEDAIMQTMGEIDIQVDLWQRVGPGMVVVSVDEHHRAEYNLLAGGARGELLKGLQNSKKGLSKIEGKDT